LPHAVVVHVDGVILLANRHTEEMFGYRREELHGGRIELLFAEPPSPAGGNGPGLRGRRKDGSEFAVEVSLGPAPAEPGVPVTAVIRDADQKQEQAQRRTNAELREQNVELEQFAYIVLFELREPLRSLVTWPQWLAKTYAGQVDARAEECLNRIIN